MPLMDMFWGDRYAQVTDPFGHKWSMAAHKENLTSAGIEKRRRAAFERMAAHTSQRAGQGHDFASRRDRTDLLTGYALEDGRIC